MPDIGLLVLSHVNGLAITYFLTNVLCFTFFVIIVKIHFDAYKTTGVSNVNNIVTYDGIHVNVGNGMDIRTGIFTALVAGVYLFNFVAVKHETKDVRFFIKKNRQNIVATSYAPAFHQAAIPMSMSSIQSLKEGETMSIELSAGPSYDTAAEMFTHFTGTSL